MSCTGKPFSRKLRLQSGGEEAKTIGGATTSLPSVHPTRFDRHSTLASLNRRRCQPTARRGGMAGSSSPRQLASQRWSEGCGTPAAGATRPTSSDARWAWRRRPMAPLCGWCAVCWSPTTARAQKGFTWWCRISTPSGKGSQSRPQRRRSTGTGAASSGRFRSRCGGLSSAAIILGRQATGRGSAR